MLLSLVLVAAMPPGAETRLASEELAARTWVAGHANALPDRLDAVSSFNMFYRKAIYRALPLEKRKALWREQLEAFLAPAEQLSAPQRRMVQALRRPLTAWERATISSVLDSLDHAFDPALTSAQRSAFGKKICRITRGAFDRSSGAIVFATPGPIDATYVRLISAPVAYRASVVGGMHLSLRVPVEGACPAGGARRQPDPAELLLCPGQLVPVRRGGLSAELAPVQRVRGQLRLSGPVDLRWDVPLAAQACDHGRPGNHGGVVYEARYSVRGRDRTRLEWRVLDWRMGNGPELAATGMTVTGVLQDLSCAVRGLGRVKGVSIVAVGTLAVAVATVTTMMCFLDAAVLRPLPFPESKRLVAISEQRGRPSKYSSVSETTVDAVRALSGVFDAVGRMRESIRSVSTLDPPRTVTVTEVDTNVLRLAGASVAVGRTFDAEDVAEERPVAVISDVLWRDQYARQPEAIGRQLRVGDSLFTIIGIARPAMRFPQRTDVWLPLRTGTDTAAFDADVHVQLIGRLRSGVALGDARARMRSLAEGLRHARPDYYRDLSIEVRAEAIDRGMTRAWTPALLLFLGAALCVFVVASANVGILMLMRINERMKEIAVRAALGAAGWRLVRQVVMESVVIGLAAAVLGAVLGWAGVRVAASVLPLGNMPFWFRLDFDWRLAAVVCSLGAVSVLAMGFLPAVRAGRADIATALRTGGDGGATSEQVLRIGRRAIVAQIAAACVLVLVTLLVGMSYADARRVDYGYDRQHLLVARIGNVSRETSDSTAERRELVETSMRIADMPAVRAVARQRTFLRLIVAHGDTGRAAVDDHLYDYERPLRPLDETMWPRPAMRVVSDDFFRALGLRVASGRGFTATDTAGAPVVAVVSSALARDLWASASPLGRLLRIGQGGAAVTVVGVMSDTRSIARGTSGVRLLARRDVFLSERQADGVSPVLVIRTAGEPTRLGPAVAAAIRRSLQGATPVSVREWSDADSELMMTYRIAGELVGISALIAVCLALGGVYAVVAYGVGQRSRELAIRMALGATSRHVRVEVVRGETARVAVGCGIGVALGLVTWATVRGVLFAAAGLAGIAPLVVAAAIGGVAMFSCYVAAGRISEQRLLQTLHAA